MHRDTLLQTLSSGGNSLCCMSGPKEKGAAESWGEGWEQGFSRVWQLQNARLGEVTWWRESQLVALLLCHQRLAGSRQWWAAEAAHLHKAFFHGLCKLGGRGFRAAVEARDAEKDALGLGVVAGSIPIGHHGPIAAKHLHGGGHLGRGQVSSAGSQMPPAACWSEGRLAPGPPRSICFPDIFHPGVRLN